VSAISRSCAKNRIGEWTAIGLPRPEGVSFMPRLKRARYHAHERDAVAVLRVHVGLHLEHEAGDLGKVGLDRPAVAGLRAARGGAWRAMASISSETPKFLSAEPKYDRGEIAIAISLDIELGIADFGASSISSTTAQAARCPSRS